MVKRFLPLLLAACAIAHSSVAQQAISLDQIDATGDRRLGPMTFGKRQNERLTIMPDTLQILSQGSTGSGSGLTVGTPIVPSRRALSDFLNAPDLLTPNNYDGSTEGAIKAYVQNFLRQRQGNTVSPFDYCTNLCGKGKTNDTAAVQSAMDAMTALQAAGVQSPVLDFRGGMFAVNAALKMTGSPYNMTFGNGSIIPFEEYKGNFFDFSETSSTTKLKFLGLVLNGYNNAQNLIHLGPKTQGTIVMFCAFYGWKGAAFIDPTTAAATENQVINNVFQGGSTANQGVAINIAGNDSEILDNIIYNVAKGIHIARASHTISRNHIYSIDSENPIPLVEMETGDQMQLVANYFDNGYIVAKNPNGLQYIANRILFTGSLPVDAFNPIVLKIGALNAPFTNILIQGNQFKSLLASPHGSAPTYTPIKVETSAGGQLEGVYNSHMTGNGFYGFDEQTTEPTGSVSGSNTSIFGINLAAKIPFGVLTAVDSVVCSFGSRAITSIGIGAGDPFNKIVYVGTATHQNGSCRAKATVNSN